MIERLTHRQEQALREQLRREARQNRPEYSESLHRRIVAAVARRRQEAAAPPRKAIWASRPFWLRATAATAVALLLAVTFLRRPAAPTPAPVAAESARADAMASALESLAALPVIDRWAEDAPDSWDDFHTLFFSTTVASQSTALQHDTRQVAEVLLTRLPVDVELLTGGSRQKSL